MELAVAANRREATAKQKKITQLPHAEWKHSRESAKKQHIRSRKNGTVEATAPPSNIYNNFSYKDIARAIVSIFI